MTLRLPTGLAVAIALLGAVTAHAAGGVAPWHATIAHGGAYDITYDPTGTTLYTYTWAVRFNGIGTGATNERMRAFALYYVPSAAYPLDGQQSADQIILNPRAERGGDHTVAWSSGGSSGPPAIGNTVSWSAVSPTSNPANSDAVFVGESIGYFRTTFRNPLPDSYLNPANQICSGIHVQWTDGEGRDRSEWVNNTPEPVSAVLVALGIPVALAARRRRTD